MTRALLEQALNALEGVLDAPVGAATQFWSCSGGVYEAVECNNAINAIQAELAKPAPYDQTALELCETCGWKTLVPGEGCLNCERPAWRDAPKCEGLWLGPRNQVIAATGPLPAKDGELWFGPITPEPEDKQ